MSKISIICCYGVLITPNPDYEKYLQSCLQSSLNSDHIIVCGGHTNSKYPDLSESDSVIEYFRTQKPELAPRLISESESLTTPQNLQNAHRIISEQQLSFDTLTICCDYIRSPKVFLLALSLFYPQLTPEQQLTILQDLVFSQSPSLTYKELTINGIRLSDSLQLAEQQILSSILEIHYFQYPTLHQRFIDWRHQLWKLDK